MSSLPIPNLDDRNWRQIVDEAVRLIPRYTPEWTNHNPSDPGMTLIELYAWMTEMMIFRLNKVPEKNFLTFLDLLGVRLLPPEPARAVLTFTPAEGAEGDLIVKKGTQVATQQSGGVDPVTFETARDLRLSPLRLARVVSMASGEVSEHAAALNDPATARETLFRGVTEVDRFLYVGDDQLAALHEEAAIDLLVEPRPGSMGPALPAITEWQYYDGRRWREIDPDRAQSGPRRLAFRGHPIAPTAIHGIESHWLRGKLIEPLVRPQDVQLDSVQLRMEILGEGLTPEHAFVNIGSSLFLPIDQGKSFYPLGEEPKFDCALYLAHDDLLQAQGARVCIEVNLADPTVQEIPGPSPDLVLCWEYWNGRRWSELGHVTPMGVSAAQGNHQFLDTSMAFSRSGVVSFDRPADLAASEVGGVKSRWIRARLDAGHFGEPGNYELQGDHWVFKQDFPLRPPFMRSLALKYICEPRPVAHVLSLNDFQFRNHSDDASRPYVFFQPFLPYQDASPAVYFGFLEAFPRETITLYFKLEESEDGEPKRGPRVAWEYWDGGRWTDLAPDDGTQGFLRSGYLSFEGPKNAAAHERFGAVLYWLRARLESGAYHQPPVLQQVTANAVDAFNAVTIREQVGSSDGSADQVMALANAPVLAQAKLWVREPDELSLDERRAIEAEHGTLAIENDAADGCWVPWTQVEHFFDSAPEARHFVLDPIEGSIRFGDGRRSQVPPAVRDGIQCEYRIGGGIVGNVGAHSLSVLKQSIAFVEKVENSFSADGGADAETLEEAKRRGTFSIKNRDRAVTAEDYEMLALAASRRVARAHCIRSARDGSVRLLIVPKCVRDGDDRAVPSRDLLDRIAAYIDRRRLITAQVHVGRPHYIGLSLEVVVRLKAGANADRAKVAIRDRVSRLLHPLTGGPRGEGWPFGRSIGKADLVPAIESIEGIDRISALILFDEDRRLGVEALALAEDELPHLVNLEITDRG